MCVPWLDSYNWTRSLNLPETQPWRPWRVQADGRSWTGGFLTQWGKNFTFLTIKHAGHMVRHRRSYSHTLPAEMHARAHALITDGICCRVVPCVLHFSPSLWLLC